MFFKISKTLAPSAPIVGEFIGTYCLITAVFFSSASGGALTVALMLVAVVFMGGHISGAHYNPAVTLGVFCSGREKLHLWETLLYILSQLAASLVASFICWGLAYNVISFPHPGMDGGPYYAPEIKANGNIAQAFAAEFIATLALVSVVLAVGTTKKLEGNSFFGLAIGFTVGAFAFAFGPISGGAFNPAVGFGPLIVDAISTRDIDQLEWMWVYWTAPLLGGLVASVIYRITHHSTDYEFEVEMDEASTFVDHNDDSKYYGKFN